MEDNQEGQERFPHLFQGFRIGSLELKNRVGLAPMTRTSAEEDGTPNDDMVKYYRKFARGGFGLIITEGTYPDQAYSQGYLNQPGIASEQHVAGWKKVVEAVHQEGAKILVQLMHAGALSQGNRYSDQTIGPSAVLPKGEQMGFYRGEGPYRVPREMTPVDIQQVKEHFVQAARAAVAAGFDGVEIHGANGYLLDQFLTDYTNQRDDNYGGSTANRVRLAAEIVAETRAALPAHLPVGIRISQGKVNDYTHKWAGGEEDAEIIFSVLKTAGADFIHVTEYQALNSAFAEGGPTLAALAKKYGQVPVLVNGNLNEPEKAEEMLIRGGADVVTIGKGALANQDWPNKVRQGTPLEPFAPEKFLSPLANLKPHEL